MFPHTNVGQLAAIPCSSMHISDEPGMYGDVVSKCEIGGVWGTVNMSQCTFRKTFPSHPVLWLVELDNMNITELRQLIVSLFTVTIIVFNCVLLLGMRTV